MSNCLKDKCSDQENISSASTFTTPIINSDHLFNKSREVIIIHENTTYKLKTTRFDKLILNK